MRTNHGIASIFSDLEGNLIIIPNSRSKKYEGSLSQVDTVFKLNSPFSDSELEGKLNKALDLFDVLTPDEESKESVIEKVLGIKGYSKATKSLKYVSIYWNEHEG
ncbi:hypothetical protein KHA93_00530 [Bacillus sp. FJAT-49732]|uniref:Uncharacterized protein n=1 Tax=Lederbergia citrisecunda TaxID=2833583 RepID=A0A942TKW2_9BACI|nr:hypothetical protein [Lederbergia citrisecunda]MBS4198144.1 hypothetical protein [Lederbergia citrisecunda]